jgi:methylated-DNA-[protein]-cysteine S-methyltransferase
VTTARPAASHAPALCTPAIPLVTVGVIETSAGPFGAVFTPRGLARLTLPSESPAAALDWIRRHAPGAAQLPADERLATLARELHAYLAGQLRSFTTPVDLHGTDFQRQVWTALTRIPYGEVRSYADIAAAVGRPKAVRAVGATNGRNPVPVIVPCHRVIGKDGSLTGYAGGLDFKRLLLRVEGITA